MLRKVLLSSSRRGGSRSRSSLLRSATNLGRPSYYHHHGSTTHLRPLSTLAVMIGTSPLYWYPTTTTSLEFLLRDESTTTTTSPLRQKTATLLQRNQQPSKFQRAFRLIRRFLKLLLVLSPVWLLYPVLLVSSTTTNKKPNTTTDAHDLVLLQQESEPPSGLLGWYLKLCLKCTEYSGAAVIKLMQWASSRPDMFGHDFCTVFCTLQDDTTPHSFRHTETKLQEAFGNDWKDHIQLHSKEILGSGCIGQVYKGVVKDTQGEFTQPVAVKVLHPNVQQDIDSDLDLMRLAVRIIRRIPGLTSLKWLNMEEVVEEFAHLLKLQLDLRIEAENLDRFNHNFAHDEDVMFPKTVAGFEPSREVLVETFCEGVPVLQFARDNSQEKETLHKLCLTGIRAVCKMIFIDNFMHADLHPGNVFVSPNGGRFIVLDVGMVNEYTEADHRMIVDILASFIRANGRKAGRLLIDDSNSRLTGQDRVHAEEEYIDKIEKLTIAAKGKGYLMEHLGTYITYICEAAATHHVMMNQAFVSAALAVKVQEGIALALDPAIEIWKVANPIILKSELIRRAKDAFSVNK